MSSKKTIFFLLFFVGYFSNNAQSLVTGKASLEKLDKSKYVISKSDGISKTIDIQAKNQNLKGVLAVLFEDCNTMRDGIFQTEYFSEKVLIKLVNTYNSCEYAEFSPTSKEIENANSVNADEVKFYGGAILGIRNTTFFDSSENENQSQFGLKFGVLASPRFHGKLQGNLYYSFEASMSFGGDKNYMNAPKTTNFSVNTYRLAIGAEYYFNKNGKINPFLGIGIGLSSDHFNGSYDNKPYKITSGNPIWMPKAGVLYKLPNGKDIGLSIDYIPEYENNLSFPNDGVFIPFIVKSSFLNIGINYYF